MASRQNSRTGADTASTGEEQRRSGKDPSQIYSGPGKTFKIKYVGAREIGDYRGNSVITDTLGQIRKTNEKKVKVSINIKFNGLMMVDEKSKTEILKVPVERVKFVCHDKHDVNIFAVVIQESPLQYKLFCFQSDNKTAVVFVRSINEMFQLLLKRMQERRREAGAAATRPPSTRQSSTSTANNKATTSTKRAQDHEEDDTPVTLGFGIPAPPPSYTAAISKKNAGTFLKPSGMNVRPVPIAPPPSRRTDASIAKPRPRKVAASSSSGLPPPIGSTTTDLPEYAEVNRNVQQQPSQQNQQQMQRDQQLQQQKKQQEQQMLKAQQQHQLQQQLQQQQQQQMQRAQQQQQQMMIQQQKQQELTRKLSQQEFPAQQQLQGPPLVQSRRNKKLPPIPAASSFEGTNVYDSIDVTQPPLAALAEAPLPLETPPPLEMSPPPVDTPPRPSPRPQQPEANIYDVPNSNPVPKGAVLSDQAKKKAAMEEWNELDNDLDNLAKELGMDDISSDGTRKMKGRGEVSPKEVSPEASAFDITPSNTSDNPFIDDFFQTSFGSPSNSFKAPSLQVHNASSPQANNQTEDSSGFFGGADDWAFTGNTATGTTTLEKNALSLQSPWGDNDFSSPPLILDSNAQLRSEPPSLPPQLASVPGESFEFEADFSSLSATQPQVGKTAGDHPVNSFNAFDDFQKQPIAFPATSSANAQPDWELAVSSVTQSTAFSSSSTLPTSSDATIPSANGFEFQPDWELAVSSVTQTSPVNSAISSSSVFPVASSDTNTNGFDFQPDWEMAVSSVTPNPAPSSSNTNSFETGWEVQTSQEGNSLFDDNSSFSLQTPPLNQGGRLEPETEDSFLFQTTSSSPPPDSAAQANNVSVCNIAPTTLVQSKSGPMLSIDTSSGENAINSFALVEEATKNTPEDNLAASHYEFEAGWSPRSVGGGEIDSSSFSADQWGISGSTKQGAPTASTTQESIFGLSAVQSPPTGSVPHQSTPVTSSRTSFIGTGWDTSPFQDNTSQQEKQQIHKDESGFNADWSSFSNIDSSTSRPVTSTNKTHQESGFGTDWSSVSNFDSQLKSAAQPTLSSQPQHTSSKPSIAPPPSRSKRSSTRHRLPPANPSNFSSSQSFGENTTAEVSNPLYQSDESNSFLGQSQPWQQQKPQQQNGWLASTEATNQAPSDSFSSGPNSFGAAPDWSSTSQLHAQGNVGSLGQQFGAQGPPQQQFSAQGPPQQQFGAQRPPQQQFGAQGLPQQQFGAQGPPQQQFGAQGQQFNTQRPPQQQFGTVGPPPQQFNAQGPPQQQFGAQGAPQQQLGFPQQQFGPQGQPQGQQFGAHGQQFGPQGQQFGPQGQQFGPQGQQFGPQGQPQGQQFGPQGQQFGAQGQQLNPQGFPQQQGQAGGNYSNPPPAPTLALSANAFSDLLPLVLSPQKSKFKVQEDSSAVKSLTEARHEAKKFEKVTVPTLNDLKSKKEGPNIKPPSGDNLLSFDIES